MKVWTMNMKKTVCFLLAFAVLFTTALPVTQVLAATGEDVVNEARRWLGTPYGHSNGSGGPGSSVDCSGLTMQVYKKFGIDLPWSSYDQANYGTYVAPGSLQPGDMVCFYDSKGAIGHVGIYIGNDSMIHAPKPGDVVKIGNYISTWTVGNAGVKFAYGRRFDLGGGAPAPAPDYNTAINTNQILRYGQHSDEVAHMQYLLNRTGYSLAVDGAFGDATLAAVRDFQGRYGLTVDGDAGPNTLTKLNEVVFGGGAQQAANASVPDNVSVSTDGNQVTVTWSASANATKYDVYLVQEPWAWENITHSASTQETSYTFYNVAVGNYNAFVIARPNADTSQSTWFAFEVKPAHVHAYTQTGYDEAHPHKVYQRCSCGDTVYTGESKKIDGCAQCNPHEHSYIIRYEQAHPHREYKECSCGDVVYTENTRKQLGCLECYPQKQKRALKLQIGIPQMTVDGAQQEIDPGRGTAPILENGRTLLPIRAVVEAFGAYVIWDETEEKITIYKDDITMYLWVNRYEAVVNHESYMLDVAPVVIHDRTFMPLRFIAERMGLTVGWNEANQTVTIEGEI